MKSLNQFRDTLVTSGDSEPLTLVQTLIATTTKQCLLESVPGFNPETPSLAYTGPIQKTSGGAGISIADMKDAHALHVYVQ